MINLALGRRLLRRVCRDIYSDARGFLYVTNMSSEDHPVTSPSGAPHWPLLPSPWRRFHFAHLAHIPPPLLLQLGQAREAMWLTFSPGCMALRAPMSNMAQAPATQPATPPGTRPVARGRWRPPKTPRATSPCPPPPERRWTDAHAPARPNHERFAPRGPRPGG